VIGFLVVKEERAWESFTKTEGRGRNQKVELELRSIINVTGFLVITERRRGIFIHQD
jgi:hypothetical protein